MPTIGARSAVKSPTCVTTAEPPFILEVIINGSKPGGRAPKSESCSVSERSMPFINIPVASDVMNEKRPAMVSATNAATAAPHRNPRLCQIELTLALDIGVKHESDPANGTQQWHGTRGIEFAPQAADMNIE